MRCGLVFSSPTMSNEKISEFYEKSLCTYEDQIPYLIKTYFKLIENIKDDLPKNPRVLEVGCGNGFFMKELMEAGFTKNVFGVEPSIKMALQADSYLRKRIKIDLFKSSLFPKDSFDLICCFHTLDHMIDPNEFIKGAWSLLKKNGYIVVVVHDTQGLSVKLFGEKSAIFDIEHIYLFNKKNLSSIFRRNNFKIIKVFNLINNYPLYYWIAMSGFPPVIKKSANFISNMLRINKLGLSIPAGNIALIAKKSV